MNQRHAALLIAFAVVAAAAVLWFQPPWLGFARPVARETADGDGTPDQTGSAAEAPQLAGRPAADRAPAGAGRVLAGTWPVALERVDRLRDLHGVVVTAGGAPIAGAHVRTESFPWRRGGAVTATRFDEAIPGLDTRSADDGSFALRLNAGQSADLEVAAEGFATARLRDRRAGERVRVALEGGVAFVLQTWDPEGKPAVGVRLELEVTGAPTQALVTDAEGRVRVAPVPVGPEAWVVVAAQAGWASLRQTVHVSHDAQDGVETVHLRRARAITGRVTDAASGQPVADAAVGGGWSNAAPVRTGPDGRYVFNASPVSLCPTLTVVAAGYARRSEPVGPSDVVDVALTRGCALTGCVVGPDGRPLRDASVVVIGSQSYGEQQRLSLADAVSDGEGRFTVRDLVHDLAHRLVARKDSVGSRTLLVPPIGGPGSSRDIGDILLTRGRTVAGRVLDAQGSPQADVEVRLVGPAEAQIEPADVMPSADYGRSDVIRTDDLGRFRFVDLEPGAYVLMAIEREPVRASRDVMLPADTDRLDEALTLPAQRRLKLIPVTDGGETVRSIRVWLRWEGGRREDMIWGPGGFDLLLPGIVRGLTVRADAFQAHLVNPDPVRVDDDATDVRIVFRRIPKVYGIVNDEAGHPVVRAIVVAWREGVAVGKDTTDEDGRFHIGIDGPDPVDLRFDGRVHAPTGSTNLLGEVTAVPMFAELLGVRPRMDNFVLVARSVPADRTVTIQVLDPAGAPARDVDVRVEPRVVGSATELRTDAAGRITLAGLPPGHLSVRVQISTERREDWWSPRLKNVAPAGQTLTLRLKRPRILEGQVLTSRGTPLAGAAVQAGLWEEGLGRVETDAQGRFRLPLNPDGPARVDLDAWAKDSGGTLWLARGTDVPVGGAPARLVAEPHDGIVR